MILALSSETESGTTNADVLSSLVGGARALAVLLALILSACLEVPSALSLLAPGDEGRRVNLTVGSFHGDLRVRVVEDDARSPGGVGDAGSPP